MAYDRITFFISIPNYQLTQNPSTHYDKGDGTNNVPIASAGYNNTTKEGNY